MSARAGLRGAIAGALLKKRGGKKKTKPSLLEKIRPLTLENNNPTRSDSETISRELLRVRRQVTRRAKMRPVPHTDERFHRHQTRVPQTSPRPACAALSPALCFYLRLIRADGLANIDHVALGKILPSGLSGDYRPWTQLMQPVCVYVWTFRFSPTPPPRQAEESSPIFFGSNVSNHLQKRDIFKKHPDRRAGGQAGTLYNTENRL